MEKDIILHPEKLTDLIDAFSAFVQGAQYSIAHSVLDDYNLWDGDTDYIRNTWIPQNRDEIIAQSAHGELELKVTLAFLDFLDAIPEAYRLHYHEQFDE